jgi:hypothetical protein
MADESVVCASIDCIFSGLLHTIEQAKTRLLRRTFEMVFETIQRRLLAAHHGTSVR